MARGENERTPRPPARASPSQHSRPATGHASSHVALCLRLLTGAHRHAPCRTARSIGPLVATNRDRAGAAWLTPTPPPLLRTTPHGPDPCPPPTENSGMLPYSTPQKTETLSPVGQGAGGLSPDAAASALMRARRAGSSGACAAWRRHGTVHHPPAAPNRRARLHLLIPRVWLRQWHLADGT